VLAISLLSGGSLVRKLPVKWVEVAGLIPVQRGPTPTGTWDSVDRLGVNCSSLSFVGEGITLDLQHFLPSPLPSPISIYFSQFTGVNLVDKIWLTGRVVWVHG
jgi:hypothetical protein